MRMRTSNKLKMRDNIASMSLTILVVDFQPSVSVYYVAVRTIVLSRHGSNLARPVIIHDIIHSLMCQVIHIVDFLWSRQMENALTFIEVLLRPTQSQSADLRGSLSPTTRHCCPSVYGTWQSQAVTHPIMNLARRCLTSVIRPTPMRQRCSPHTMDVMTYLH